MKITSAAVLAFTFCLTSGTVRAADPAPTEDSLRLGFGQTSKSIGVLGDGGAFHPMITRDKLEDTYILPLGSRLQPDGTVAIYGTGGQFVGSTLPLARYSISGPGRRSRTSRTALTLKLENGQLEVSAKEASAHGKALTVKRLSESELAKATLPAAKASKLPAIAEGSSGKKLGQSVGLRTGDAMFAPFLRAGAMPGETATVTTEPKAPGQTSAEITVYGGESPYIEKDRVLKSYRVSGLSTNPKARFALKFTVSPAGKLVLTEATDTATKQALTMGSGPAPAGETLPAIGEAPSAVQRSMFSSSPTSGRVY